MKAAILALVLTAVAPLHVSLAGLGAPGSFPAGWLVLAAEALAAAGVAGLVARKLRGFRPPLFVMARRAGPWAV